VQKIALHYLFSSCLFPCHIRTFSEVWFALAIASGSILTVACSSFQTMR